MGATASQSKKDDIPLLTEEREKKLDDTQVDLSAKVVGAAEWLDSFFDDGRVLSEENKSRGSLKFQFQYTENDDFETNLRASLRLHFPKLTEKLNLLILADEDEDFDVDGDPTLPDQGNSDRGNVEVALQYFFKDDTWNNLSGSLGGSYNYLYAGLRYRYLENFGKWNLRFTDRLRYYTNDGWENRASLDLERKISGAWMFRSITSATLAEIEDGIPHSQIFRLYQVLSNEQAVLYETGLYLDTEPDYDATDLQFKIRYRQRFYRDWLVLEIVPFVNFPEEYDREANPGILFQLEANFGYDSNDRVFEKVFSF